MAGGHGFETERLENVTNGTEYTGAECMGLMYTFSMWSYFTLLWMVQKVFIITLICFIGLLVVGKKRVRCDHHDPSLLKEIRKLCGSPPVCNGGCHVQTLSEWTLDRIMDEFAWSFYALSVGTWTLTFLMVSFGLMIFAWSIVLWALVMLILIAAAVAALCMLCGEAGGQSCDCNCDCTDCGCCDPEPGLLDDTGVAEMMYFGGPHPVDGMFWFDCSGLSGSSTGDGCCCNCSGICCPIAWLVLRFPRMPENMWGGFLGWCMRTHPLTPAESAYGGGSDFIDVLAMQWMRAGDLHGHSEWRRQVQTFLYDMDYADAELLSNDMGTMSHGERSNYRIGNTTIEKIPRKFGEGDRCVQSSFEDYMNNNCWICQSKDETLGRHARVVRTVTDDEGFTWSSQGFVRAGRFEMSSDVTCHDVYMSSRGSLWIL
eukprot:Skav222197  [mRNA]  locus=scaffold1745:70942:72680:- [translate_table: standard]